MIELAQEGISTGDGLSTLAAGVAIGGAAIGVGIGLVFSNTMARQPETAAQTRTTMFLGFALIEALVFITFVLTFII